MATNRKDVEKLDLLIGTLSEGHRPDHLASARPCFKSSSSNATRRLQADRFYTDSYNEQTYHAEGLDWDRQFEF